MIFFVPIHVQKIDSSKSLFIIDIAICLGHLGFELMKNDKTFIFIYICILKQTLDGITSQQFGMWLSNEIILYQNG